MARAMNYDDASKEEHLYKIIVIGDTLVGKTTLIRRYIEGSYCGNYKVTIGVDFALKSLNWDHNTTVKLQLWDIAGFERFRSMTRVYYKDAIAAIIVYDLGSPETFESVLKWLGDVNSKVFLANGEPIPVLLMANKCDLEEVTINTDFLDEFCKEHKLIGWFKTSAKSGINIDEAFRFLVQHILQLSADCRPASDNSVLQVFSISEEGAKTTRKCCSS